MREVYVLGAGFSRAISPAMPLTDDLGRKLAERDPETFAQLGSRSFEQWLSHRAEMQPYLSSAENLARRSVFVQTTAQIGDALDTSIAQVLQDEMVQWLGELISLWHLNGAQVLTFNYDPLVECAFDTLEFNDWRTDTQFTWGSLLNYNPKGMAGASFGELDGTSGPHPSFRLWKLHGSTNWFWTPGDVSGASAMRINLPGRFGGPVVTGDGDHHWMAPGRERLLVPPSSLKSAYYDNPVTREIWSRAFEALCNADVITLIGYSMPQTDLTTVGMLAEAAAAGRVSEIRVVNRSPQEVANRLRTIVPANIIVEEFAGEDTVASYVAAQLRDAMASAVSTVRALEMGLDARVLATWGDVGQLGQTRGRTARVTSGQRVSDSVVLLEANEPLTFDGATYTSPSAPEQAMRLSDLVPMTEGATELRVRIRGTQTLIPIIDVVERRMGGGQGDGGWAQLVPAGQLPQQ